MRGVLNPLDDYAVHQTPEPVAHPASTDANAYDRYFFNGYDDEGTLVFAVALGVYPNRRIIDAAVTVVHEGRQRSLHASGRMPTDRTVTAVGPIVVEVIEPLSQLRVTASAADLGIEADLTFTATTPVVEEPRYQWRVDQSVVMDLTRMTQFGRWSGSIDLDGTRHIIRPEDHRGCRDRSWGIRPVGDQARGADRHVLPQFFWLWAPVNLDGGGAVHLDVNEYGDGRRWHQAALLVPSLGTDATPDERFDPAAAEWLPGLDHDLDWVPGTRRAATASFDLTGVRGARHRLELEPVTTLLMKGLGYSSADWPHGGWKGELAVGSEAWVVDELDPIDITNVHVQQLVRARLVGPDGSARTGTGVLEILAVNAHEPTGLQGFSDGFTPS